MTESEVDAQKPAMENARGGASGDAPDNDVELDDNASRSIELVCGDEAPKPRSEDQPDWYMSLDEVSRCDVRHLCEEAGVPPSDPKTLNLLHERFNIHLDEAADVVELYFAGKLQGPMERPKSILKSRSQFDDGPPLQKQLSWSDENGGDLTERREMDSWHYMHSKRNPPNQCCSIL